MELYSQLHDVLIKSIPEVRWYALSDAQKLSDKIKNICEIYRASLKNKTQKTERDSLFKIARVTICFLNNNPNQHRKTLNELNELINKIQTT